MADVAAPLGSAELDTTTAPVFTAVTLPLSVDSVDSVAKPVMAAGGGRVVT